jgi:hypothetical protein
MIPRRSDDPDGDRSSGRDQEEAVEAEVDHPLRRIRPGMRESRDVRQQPDDRRPARYSLAGYLAHRNTEIVPRDRPCARVPSTNALDCQPGWTPIPSAVARRIHPAHI